MSNEHNTGNNRQPRQQAQQDPHDSNRRPDPDAQPDKLSGDSSTRSDRQNQEKEGKGKIATSAPGGSGSDKQRS